MKLYNPKNDSRIAKSYLTFVEGVANIHKDKYLYDKTVFTKSNDKVIITCRVHGDFEQTAYSHRTGTGCVKCMGDTYKITRKVLTKDIVLEKCKKVHGDTFKYPFVDEEFSNIGADSNIRITCTKHGDFLQRAVDHYGKAKRGCPKCAEEARIAKRTVSVHGWKYFYDKASITHNNKYTYDFTAFKNNKSVIPMVCPIHGNFKQRIDVHIKGQQCPSCAKHGFDPSKPGTLYYLEINGGEVYKIGITNLTVQLRFRSKELDIIKVIKTWDYEVGEDAYIKEQEILKEFKEFQYTGVDILKSGNTEMFSKDILHLINI